MLQYGQFSKTEMRFDEAWLYIACSFEKGYSDWRMPTLIENINHVNDYLRANIRGSYSGPWDQSDYKKPLYIRHTVLPVREKND